VGLKKTFTHYINKINSYFHIKEKVKTKKLRRKHERKGGKVNRREKK
jgi:hypothetical protein